MAPLDSVYASDWPYTFRPGDTLWDICKQYTKEPGCWQKLGPYNNIDANRRIAPGTRINIPATWLKVPAASASILYVKSAVTLMMPGEQPVPARAGDKLPIGATLLTRDGSATIGFADGSSMVLEAHSELTLDTLSNFEEHGMVDSTVRLRRGTVKTRVIKREPRSQFKTITPTAVASVRGTEYRVNLVANSPHQKQTALVEVYEGLVDVGAQQKNYDVPAEFGIVTKQGQAPQPPVKLLPAPAFKNLKNTYSIAMEPPNAPAEGLPIQWQALEGAEAFRLEILAANDSNKEQVDRLLQSRVVQQPQTHLTGLKPDCYYLRLRGIDALGLQGMATKRRVCLYPQISAPVAQLEDKNDSPNLLHLTWQAPQGAQSIRLEVAEDAGFERLIDEREMRADRFEAHYDAPVFLRMVALDAHGEKSPYSDVLQWQPGEKPEGKWWFLAPPGLYLLGLLLI